MNLASDFLNPHVSENCFITAFTLVLLPFQRGESVIITLLLSTFSPVLTRLCWR